MKPIRNQAWSKPSQRGITPVPVVNLDNIVIEHKWMNNPVLIMIDVETWEENVLAGAERLITANPKPLWIIEILPNKIARRKAASSVFSTMFENGYRGFQIGKEGHLIEHTKTTFHAYIHGQNLPNDWHEGLSRSLLILSNQGGVASP